MISFAGRGSKKDVEEGLALAPKFDADGLIPAITVDAADGSVLMLAYMNSEALARTLELGEAVYWSRSRQELWHKGATSGNTQKVRELRVDCDQDAILLFVEQQGGAACHTGRHTCFYRRAAGADGALELVDGAVLFDPEKVYGRSAT